MDITIVIPVYNRKELVGKTLNTIPDTFNIIIVDNGSTDGSYEFCRQWVLNSRRQNVQVDREFKQGAAKARNRGLSLCKTKWVYFFDSDDEFTGLPSQWNENLDMLCFPTTQIVNGKTQVRAYQPVSSPHTHILNSMLNTISVVYRTEWLRSIGGWNEKCMIWDDWELGVRALLNSPRLEWETSKAYHKVRVHGNSLTGNSFSKHYEQSINTFAITFENIYNADKGEMKQKAMFALFLRCNIFCGQLQKEGNIKAAEEVENFICERFNVNDQSKKMGKLFRWYASKGGRGAWKIALWLV